MTNLNFIAAGIIIVIAAIIIGINIYKKKQITGTYTMDDFIMDYGDDIIEILKNVIEVLKVNMDMFETQDDYETAIISTTIESLKENSYISSDIINLFDTDALTNIVKSVFCDNKCDVMAVLDTATIVANAVIIDKEVVEVIGTEAIEE